MKDLFIAITALSVFFISSAGVNAQNTEHDSRVSAGFGVLTAPDIMEVTASFSTIIISGGTIYTDNINSTGALFINYDHAVTPHVMVGFGTTYSRLGRDLMAKINDTPTKIGRGSSDYYSVMGRFHHQWLNTERVRVYYGVGFGFTIIHDQADIDVRYKPENTIQNAFHVAFQLTPIGIEVGKKLSVFLEAGLGFNGLAAGGLSYKF